MAPERDRPGSRPHRFRIVLVAVVALFAASIWLLMTRAPTRASVARIDQALPRWKGRRVRIRGRLLEFHGRGQTVYGVVQGTRGYRIGIRHLRADQASLAGRTVVAVGVVRFGRGFGVYLAHPSLTAAARPASE